MSTPYGMVADVKMLNFFRDIGQTAAIVIAFWYSSPCWSRTFGADISVRMAPSSA